MNLLGLWFFCRPPISELIDVFVASCPVARFPWRWSKVCVVNILVLVSMMDGCRHIGRENLIDFPFLFPLDSKDTAGNQNDSIWAKAEVSFGHFCSYQTFLALQPNIWLNAFYPTDVLLCSGFCPFKHRFRLFTPHLWHSSIGIGAKSFGWLVWRRNLSSSTIGTPGALRQANLWSFMCLSKSCCFSWQNSFWNSKGWTSSIFALRRKTIDPPYQKPHVFKGLKAKAYFLHFYGLEW